MYEASEYTPDYGARERALQLLANVKKREEGSKVVRLDKRTLVVRNEKRMDEDLRKETEKKPRKKTVAVTTNRHKPSVCAEQGTKKPNRTKAKPIRAKISMEAIMQKTGTIQRKRVGITFIDFCAAEIAELRRMGENTTAERYEKVLRGSCAWIRFTRLRICLRISVLGFASNRPRAPRNSASSS
uniref:hypothetical protein n=1 Tax=Candidatus Limisoma sp. TaxID=3076476 RepID=UPI004029BC55